MFSYIIMRAHTEKYNREYAEKLSNITHEDMATIWGYTEDSIKGEMSVVKTQTNILRKLCKEAIKNNYRREINYKYSKKTPDSGRMYTDGCSLQNIKKCFRGLLSSTTSIEIDAKNCHPILLLKICNEKNILTTALHAYTTNRDYYINEFAEAEDITPARAKTLFLKTINSSHKITRATTSKKLIKYTFFLSFDAEIKSLQQKFKDQYADEYNIIKQRERDNHNGKLMARILNIEESLMLKSAVVALDANDYQVMTEMFDGLLVDLYTKLGEKIVNNDVVKVLEEATQEWGISWIIKQPDLSLTEFADNLCSTENVVLYAQTECDLVRKIFKHFYHARFYKRDGAPFLLINHQWLSNIETIKSHIYESVSCCHGYIESINAAGEIVYKLITQSMAAVKSITEAILRLSPENRKFMDEVEARSLNKISFKQGYYDFAINKFILYTNAPEYDTINIIDRDFEYYPPDSPIRGEIYSQILNKMFCGGAHEARDSFLYEISRAICGKMSDKIWFNMRGERDSCKGVFDLLIRNSLSTYIGSFNTSSFELDTKSVTDPELKQKFLIKNRYSRLAISQEVSEKWLDGDLIKKVSSGGDKIDARNLFKNIETFRNSCKYMMIGNGMPRVKPVDALDNRWFYEIKAKFVADPAQHQELKGIQVFKADPDIKNVFCCRDDVMNAFCSIIFDAFNKPCALPKELVDDDGNVDPHKEAMRLFRVGDPSDCLTNKELKAILSQNKECFDSLCHMKKILKQHFAVDMRGTNGRGLKHIQLND